MTNNDVIIINYEMIPYATAWGPCQRSYYLAEFLTNKGINTTVAANKLTDRYNDYEKKPNFKIIFTNNKGSCNSTFQNRYTTRIAHHLKNFIKPIIYTAERLYFNEINQGSGLGAFLWVNKLLSQLNDLIDPNKKTVIIISCPPFASLAVINKIKKSYPRVRIIIDYRDPWNLWNNARGLSFVREKKYIKLADKIAVTTDTLKDVIINTFNVNEDKVAVIANGYSEKDWSDIEYTPKNNNKIVVSYIGSIVFQNGTYRNTTEFFKAYDLLEDKDLYEIRFIGVTSTPETESLRQKYPEISFIPKVSASESFRYMYESDVLFNLHTEKGPSSKYLIGGKIYDYIRSGKLILSINSKKSFEQTLLKQTGNAICCENNHLEILRAFKQIKTEPTKHRFDTRMDTNRIRAFSREYQNDKYYELIKQTASN
jgi:glycosyltransferase involved in cell wall biosynthesis